MITPQLPSGSLIQVERTTNGLKLNWKNPDNAFLRVAISGFLLFWLGGWTFGGILAMQMLWKSYQESISFSLFLLIWLGGWAFGEIFVIVTLSQICEKAPFSQATLVRFRMALIIHGLDRRLIERTVELAEQTKGFGSKQLRAALDSSPLWGASKVEDTYNLLGHALKKAIGVIARQQGRGLTEIANEIGVDIVAGSSLKAALDLNWDEPDQKNLALGIVLDALEQFETFVQAQPENAQHPQIRSALSTARLIEAQDVEIDAHGEIKLLSGVAFLTRHFYRR